MGPRVYFTLRHPYWKGILHVSAAEAIELAQRLVERRLVACAQASSSGRVHNSFRIEF